MKKFLNTVFLFLAATYAIPSYSSAATATIEVIQSSDAYHAGETYPVIFRVRIIDGWFIHGNEKGSEEIIPTVLTFMDQPLLKIKDIRFPDTLEKKFDYLTEPIDIFSGEILIKANLVVDKGTPSGAQGIKGSFSYQACSINACRAPENIPVEWTASIVSNDRTTREINKDLFLATGKEKDGVRKDTNRFDPDKGLIWTLALIFLGGLALNLSPCIYPIIPITVSYFCGKTGRMKGDILVHCIMYLIGLSVTNSIMGVASALSGNMLGSVLQHPAALIIIALIMTLLGLSFFDLWEIRVPSSLNRVASKNFNGYFGTFFMGLTLGIIAAPCIGPFVLGLLAYVGQKGDPVFGFFCFFILSMGMGLPVCLLALFSGAMKRLPLSGGWMLWIRRVMGWVLIGMAIYILSPLISGRVPRAAVFLAAAAAAGIHLGWLEKAGQESVRFVCIKRSAGVLLILLGAGCFYSAISFNGGVRWTPYAEGLLIKAKQEGKPVVLDFYADWCLPCKVMDKTVLRDEEVVSLSEKFIMMRLDLTTKQPAQERILETYHVIGVPTIIFLDKDGNEEDGLRIESRVGRDEFLSAMEQALQPGP